MKVVFRVDASHAIASGHVTRCLALAQSLRGRGAECIFIGREVDGHLFSSVIESGFEQRSLPGPLELTHHHMAGDGLRPEVAADANSTIEALAGDRADWLIIDHSAIGAEWERILRPHVDRILVIDDLADRHHECDVFLDQNFSDEPPERYGSIIPTDCQLLLGPRYALLKAEYAKYRADLSVDQLARERILVFFGGTDQTNLTGRSLGAISANGLEDLPADIVVGANNPHLRTIKAAAQLRPNTRVYGPRPHLADLMAMAILSLGAGGTTTWERLCLGVPSVVVSLAANQVPTCAALARAGLIEYLGPSENVTSAALSEAAQTLLNKVRSPHGPTSPSNLVDGLGSGRVCEILTSFGHP